MSKALHKICVAIVCAATTHGVAEEAALKTAHAASTKHNQATQKAFTGKIIGNSVRLRTDADVDSSIVKELSKGELLVVVGEKNDFYAVQPTSDVKAYVFRSFVLDNVVEGNHVNVRLGPELDAPIIGHLNTGDKVIGKVSEANNKWLEIAPPTSAKFYVAKEFVEYIGGSELKAIHDRKQQSVVQLMEKANLKIQSEMRKQFEEISIDEITAHLRTIVNDYQDFPEYVKEAQDKLTKLQESYLQKKLAFLESKAAMMDKASKYAVKTVSHTESDSQGISPTDRMKVWEPVEEAIYLSWANRHHAKTMNDFYDEEKMSSSIISGILESYNEPVKKKPGDYLLRERGVPVAYVYSTHVNLHNFVGKQVNLVAAERPNNNFAFPCYYVLEVE